MLKRVRGMVCLLSVAVDREHPRLSGRRSPVPKNRMSLNRSCRPKKSSSQPRKHRYPVTQVTSAVEVITAQDMKNKISGTWPTPRTVGARAGRVFERRTGNGGQRKNSRGGSSQTLVLIDGAIVNSGNVGRL